MIKLVEPSERYISSYTEAMEEYRTHHITTYAFTDASSEELLAKFDNYKNERNLKPGRVGSHFFWLVDDEKDFFIGEISIRHQLTPALERYGGHIGYGVRFSCWNKGLGTLMLKLALEQAQKIGLSRVLITCDDDNPGSARVMEKNGFTLCDKIENTLDSRTILTRRYWKTL